MSLSIGEIIADARKTQVTVLGLVLQVISLGVLHGSALHVAQVVVAALTTVGVYLAPNGPLAAALGKGGDTGPGFSEEPDVSEDPAGLTWPQDAKHAD